MTQFDFCEMGSLYLFSASSASLASPFISYRSVFIGFQLYRRALPARRDGTKEKKGTFLFFLPLSSANNIFSYEIIFDLDKKISTRNPINPRTFLPSAFGLNGVLLTSSFVTEQDVPGPRGPIENVFHDLIEYLWNCYCYPRPLTAIQEDL